MRIVTADYYIPQLEVHLPSDGSIDGTVSSVIRTCCTLGFHQFAKMILKPYLLRHASLPPSQWLQCSLWCYLQVNPGQLGNDGQHREGSEVEEWATMDGQQEWARRDGQQGYGDSGEEADNKVCIHLGVSSTDLSLS